ncbi:MAG: hypothetical protein ACHQF0_03940 [Chitinophagales bacterium]
MSQTTIEGEYYFKKMEMASGFNFSKDGTFQFFYTYGAVDRTATGSFTVEGDTLKLKSDKEPGKDFTITDQSKQGNGYSITFRHQNKYLLKNIVCIFVVDGKGQEAYSDENGEVHADLAKCDTIYVVHNLYPDIPTLVKDEKNDNNRFTLELKPSLEQVSFKGIDFMIIDKKTISCLNNYFMDATDIKFVKQ